MSSETDHPRQRTVAELLAAHGDANATGRRRRRREADEPDEGVSPAHGAPAADPADWRSAPPREPDPAGAREAMPPPQRESPPRRRAAGGPAAWEADRPAVDQRDANPWESAPWASAHRDPAQHDPAQRDPGQRESAQRESAEWDAGQWDAGQWEAGQWDADPWDPEPREDARRTAPPAQPAWDAHESRYPGPPSRGRAQRREPEDWDPALSWDAAPTGAEPRSSREAPEAAAWEPRGPEPARNGRATRPREWEPAQPEQPRRRAAGAASAERPGPEAPPDVPTEQMPRVRDASAPDPARTTRMQQQRRRPEPEADAPEQDDDGGPSTMVGAAPVGAEAWHRARTEGKRRSPDGPEQGEDDDGPATMVGGAPAGAEAWHRARTEGRRGPADGGPPTQAAAPVAYDDEDDFDDPAGDYPAGLGRRSVDEEPTGFFAPDDEPEAPPKRRSAKIPEGERSSTPPWAAVIAQWIAGAIGGAALWVGFRFLWRDLPVVALAAAVLVTVGLVVVVRALLRSNDLRTTLFAVLVGLLLTVSPAILVLLGR
ncbi:MAG TPA: hypothetical protein VD903_19260 [Pseudonocardia sp.]|nr:hypothetical protein [Pseudonocardia sp.]